MEKNEMLIRIRDNFMKIFEKDPNLFDKEDVMRVNEEDWTIKRYLLQKCYHESSALHMMTESMKWRKEFGISEMDDNYFPREFYSCGALFSYCNDKSGRITLYLRIKLVHKIPEMNIFFKKFLVHHINKVDQQSYGKGWVLVIDASEARISNCDIDMLCFLITILKNYFPYGLRYILAHEMPWALQGVWRVAKAWVPRYGLQLIKFTTNKDISHYIDADALPEFLGGFSKREYRAVPDGCPDTFWFGTEVAKLPIDKVLKIVDHYQPFISKDCDQ